MKRFLRIVSTILLIIAGSVLLLFAGVYFGSKALGFKKSVDHPVYGPSKKWVFLAEFRNAQQQLLRSDTLVLQTYNERFLLTQNKITWSLSHNNEHFEEITGIVENTKELWIHPPRFEGYISFTEYAPFPSVQFPLSMNSEWSGSMLLGSHATKASGPSLEKTQRVVNIDTLSSDPFIRRFRIEGTGRSGLGVYRADCIFSEDQGFTEMLYRKPDNSTLNIRLIGILPAANETL